MKFVARSELSRGSALAHTLPSTTSVVSHWKNHISDCLELCFSEGMICIYLELAEGRELVLQIS